MKTIAKKSLSVFLAALMALSTLTVGASVVFADDTITDYADNVVTAYTNNTTTTVYYKYTAPTTGYYSVILSVAEQDSTSDISASGSVRVYTTDEDDATVREYSKASASSSMPTLYYVENGVRKSTTAYKPAQTMVQLTKGEVYQIAVTASANTNATLLVSQSDYVYTISTYSAELTYSGYEYTDDVYNSETGTYEEVTKVEILDYARTYDYTVGICANISCYDGTETALTIPSTLGGYAVKSVDLGDTKTALAKRITSVSIPEGVETIDGMDGFYALASVNLPSTLKTIGYAAFNGCHALTGRITIPASVESVGSYAFYDTGIASVEFLGSDTTVGTQAFGYAVVLNEATVDPTDTTTGKTDGFFVVAPTGSYAEQYAVNNGFTSYDRANCNAGNHPYTVTKVAATLFAKGSTTSVCPVCGNTTKKTIKKKTFKIKSLKSTKKNTLTVKVAKKSSVTGYQVQYSTSKKFTKKTTTTVKVSSKKVNKTITGLTGGKKYYVRVRAYKTTNGKTVYSKYTATKSVKVKK